MKQITLTLPAPYVGLRPFEESDALLFFGRNLGLRNRPPPVIDHAQLDIGPADVEAQKQRPLGGGNLDERRFERHSMEYRSD